jgi:L-asparaginase / beta-aspartyl-peptidase
MILLVHGGAGFRRPGARLLKKLAASLSFGFHILQRGGSSLEAVTEAIQILEDSGFFNAGAGANLQFDGVRRLDASLMDGKDLNAGSVIGLEGIRNPVMTAEIIMDLPHVILTHKGAKNIADAHKLAPLPQPDKKAIDKLEIIKRSEIKFAKLYKRYFSTVGAVALDRYRNLAAGSSTGGVPAMLPGRVGDTPIIGSGIYADNSLGAVSCTGTGEFIIRLVLAKEICMNMKMLSPQKSSVSSLQRISALGGQAGVIVLNRQGRFAITHTTDFMASGYATGKGITVQQGFKQISKD